MLTQVANRNSITVIHGDVIHNNSGEVRCEEQADSDEQPYLSLPRSITAVRVTRLNLFGDESL